MAILGIYDGDCGICSAFVRFAQARVRRAHAQVSFVPFGTLGDEELARYGLTTERCFAAFQAVDPERGVHLAEGGPAIRLVTASTGGALGTLARVLGYVPGYAWIERRAYAAVARNRAKISVAAGYSACALPSAPDRLRHM